MLFRSTLLFTANEDGWLRDALAFDETEMVAEAYTKGSEQLHLLLNFEESGSGGSGFRLLSARPNPFSENTSIAYFAPLENPLTLTISDLSGRTVFEETKPSGTGHQTWKIGKQEIPKPGLYIYRLKCLDGWAAGKLMVE